MTDSSLPELSSSHPSPWRGWRAAALPAAVFAVLDLPLLALRPLGAPDEFRYAEIAREMLASGDWVVPRLDGLLYFEKPPLGYWLMALSQAVLGPTALAIRLPAALATVLAAACVFWLLRRQDGPDWQASVGAAAYLAMLLPAGLGATAILDAPFAGLVTLALTAAWAGLRSGDPGGGRLAWLVSGAAMGAAFLVKGFLALVIPGLALLPYLLWSRGLGRFLRRSWLMLLPALAVALPWSLVALARTEFWTRFIWVEHLQRFMEAGANQHAEPPWYYLVWLLPAALPVSLLLPAAVPGWRDRLRRGSGTPFLLFAVCWLVAPLGFFSLASGKQLTYMLPCLPALACLLVAGAAWQGQRGRSGMIRAAGGVLAALACLPLLAAALPTAASGRIGQLLAEAPSLRGVLVVGLVWAVAAGLGVVVIRRRPQRSLALLALSPVLCLVLVGSALDGRVARMPAALIQRHLQQAGPQPALVGTADSAHALCWLTRRTDVQIFGRPSEFDYGLERAPGRSALDGPGLAGLIRSSSGPVLLVFDSRRWQRLQDRLPDPDVLDRDRYYTLALYLP